MRRSVTLIGCLLGVLAVLPASADWLVTHDGARIETKGSWKVKGNQVIFTLPNGTLSTIRKSDVDLDASAVATAGSQAAPKAKAEDEAPRKSVLVLTNKDVRRADEANAERAAAAAADGEASAPEGAAPAAATRRGVELVSYTSRDSSSVDGLEVVGTIKNTGVDIAANVTVKVTVIDQDGTPLLDTSAFLRSTGLAPGKSTTFRALLPGVFSLFQEPQFEISSGNVSVGGPAAAEPDDEDSEDDSAGDLDPQAAFEEGEG